MPQDKFQEHVRWVEHRGVRFLYVHYRGLDEEQMLAVLDLTTRYVTESPSNKLRMLANMEGSTITTTFMTRLKHVAKEVLDPKLERIAMVGVTGLKVIFLQALNALTGNSRKQKLFSSEDEAKEWLAMP